MNKRNKSSNTGLIVGLVVGGFGALASIGAMVIATSTEPQHKPTTTAKQAVPAVPAKSTEPKQAVSPLRPFPAEAVPPLQEPTVVVAPQPVVAESVNLDNYRKLAVGMSKLDVQKLLGGKYTTVLHKSLRTPDEGGLAAYQYGSIEAAAEIERMRQRDAGPQEQEIDEWNRDDGKGSITVSFIDGRANQIKKDGSL